MEKEIKKKRRVIECSDELIEILDELRNPINDFTWGVVNKSIGYYELTAILARKIKGKLPK